MSPSKVWAFSLYEIRRAIARKKVLALVVLFVLFCAIAGVPAIAAAAAASTEAPVSRDLRCFDIFRTP